MRLNLCSGFNLLPDYENVDMMATSGADRIFDLETFPWPWEDSSIEEIRLYHALEHLGQQTEIYLAIWKELYRISKNGAKILITVPYPWHDNFIDDPTHVRVVTPDGLRLFSKEWNLKNIDGGFSNTPLGIYLDIDFEVVKVDYLLEPVAWERRNDPTFKVDMNLHRNLVREIYIEMKAVK